MTFALLPAAWRASVATGGVAAGATGGAGYLSASSLSISRGMA